MACWRILLALGKELNQGCSQMSRPPIRDVGIWGFWCSWGKQVEKYRLRVQICKLFACWPPELRVSRSSSLGLVSDLNYVYIYVKLLSWRECSFTPHVIRSSCEMRKGNTPASLSPLPSEFFHQSSKWLLEWLLYYYDAKVGM